MTYTDLSVALLACSLNHSTTTFGTGLSQALRIYADSLRSKRRLEIESTINKAAVKMVFPIVLFVLPALFVVILAPGVISTLRDLQLLR